MDRENILHLARLLDTPKPDTRRGNIVVRCPMAPLLHASGADEHPAFSVMVTPDRPSPVKCFACGISGLLVAVLEEAHEGTGLYAEALAFVREADQGGFAGALARLRVGREGYEEEPRRAGFDVPRYVARCSRTIPQYLIDRGIVRSDVRRWRLGYDEEMRRAVFPVWDEHGTLVGASRRTVFPKEVEPIKYLDTPGFPKDEVWYGEHNVDPTREELHVVEGILDTIWATRVLPNVVGLMGANTGIGPARLKKLRRWARKVTLILDSDLAGRQAVEGYEDHRGEWQAGLREKLQPYVAVRVAWLPEGRDPADVPAETLLEAARNASYLLS